MEKKNRGNTFVIVVATLSFLAVLTAAILVAVALCYRLKAYDINSRDNFYYLEQAMDELYAGVGADAMKHLNSAYDDTVEVLVYYDTKSNSYITMENDDANTLMKKTFIKLVKEDTKYNNTNVKDTLTAFLSNGYDGTSNPEGVQLYVNGNVTSDDTSMTIKRVTLKREASYSTVNTRSTAGGKETFVQTITTDLVISQPEFNVNFNTISSDLNDLYEFAFIADLGAEISGATNNINITGNIYAASDFYNKSYNETSGKTASSDPDAIPVNTKSLTSYSSNDMKLCNGVNLNSMYSGLYIDGANVVVASDKIIVPGTIAAMNGANLVVTGSNSNSFENAQVWADNITLGGYSFKATGDKLKGSEVVLRADAYISDDLELNATGSSFTMNGGYYGYNYATTDNRTYTDDAIMTAKSRTFVSNVPDSVKNKEKERYSTVNGKEVAAKTQAHYNSSAIIVNGQDSKLDLSNVSAMYVAGQAYIEMTKKTETTSADDNSKNNVTVENKSGDQEAVTTYTYNYVSEMNDDNKTTSNYDVSTVDENGNKKVDESVQDYRTGEAITVKSNQLAYLAYIPNGSIEERDNGDVYLKLPDLASNGLTTGYKDLDLFKETWENLDEIPVVKTVVSGKTYYYFDFSEQAIKDSASVNEFIAEYSNLLSQTYTDSDGNKKSVGESYGLTNINNYEYFKIDSLSLKEDLNKDANDTTGLNDYMIYSNSAISVMNGTTLTVKAKSSNIKALQEAAKNINEAELAKAGIDVDSSKTSSEVESIVSSTNGVSGVTTSGNSSVVATSVTTKLQSQYKEMKWLLSNTNIDSKSVTQAHTIEESEMTPINHFFDFDSITDKTTRMLDSGYGVWISDGDVKIGTSLDGKQFKNGHVRGLVICKGDVTFDSSVKSFEGLIVTGSKLKVTQSMDFTANAEIIKSVLRECDESQKYKSSTPAKDLSKVCSLFRGYTSIYTDTSVSGGGIEVASTKTISAVQFEDILGFENWMKNVD